MLKAPFNRLISTSTQVYPNYMTCMNCEEGHLGGYLRASPTPTPSGLNLKHGDPATWSPNLWLWTYENLGVRSVLDVGCGEGHCAGFFKSLGCDILGIDGSIQAKRDSVISDNHVIHDFTKGPYAPPENFDLVWSCEFIEHVENESMANFLTTFQYARRYVMLTYASPGQPGWHHVNCQPATYWIKQLEQIGFKLDPQLTFDLRNIAEPGHFERKGLVFIKRDLG